MGGDLPSSAFGTSARLPYYYRYSRIGRKKATPVPPPPYFAADCDLTTSKTATFFLSLSLRKLGQRPNSARAAVGGGGGAQNGSEAQAEHGGLTLQFVSDAKLQHVWDVLQTSHRVLPFLQGRPLSEAKPDEGSGEIVRGSHPLQAETSL